VLAQHDDATAQKMQELQVMVEQQAAEIQRLKTEKEFVEASASQLSSHQAKVEHENKILKRAVTIQQERQNQMTAELEGARQFKAAAEERVRRLEQMNLTLQYRLQATMASEKDFTWSNPRPPDVY
jgi:GTP-sensing pleiotropic transcriptional regulator CodY